MDLTFKTAYQKRAAKSMSFGLLLCFLVALFPPYRITVDSGTHTAFGRNFLFTDQNVIKQKKDGSTEYYSGEIDSGRLLGEFILIFSLSGMVSLYCVKRAIEEANS